jgi:hypothetical protein
MDISYDNAQDFFQDLGFNKLTIDRLKPYFSALEGFVDYDVFAIIERLEADILANEDSTDKLAIESQQDFFQALCLFGFQDEWAQTYTWAMGKVYADQLVKHSIEECIRLRLSSSNTIEPFPDWTSDLQNNQWQTYRNPEFREDRDFFVRKQNRNDQSNFGSCLDDIDLANLNLPRSNLEEPQYWFHATNWAGAEGILRNGADLRGQNTDFSRSGAYYLNNDYRDSYDFIFKRNHAFMGQQAILIYRVSQKSLPKSFSVDFHYFTY